MMQFFLRYQLITPILSLEGKMAGISKFEFILLVFSCMLIAAGGYVINDVEDVRIDQINKPEKIIIKIH